MIPGCRLLEPQIELRFLQLAPCDTAPPSFLSKLAPRIADIAMRGPQMLDDFSDFSEC
jgi:hypothetical protein